MAITYVGAGDYSSSGIAPSPTLPAGVQEGDILVLFRESMNGGAEFDALNWNEVSGSPSYANTGLNGTRTALGIFWRRATASETAPIMNDTGNHSSAIIHAFRGCKATGDPFNTSATSQETTATTTGTAPSINTTVNNCWIVLGATHSDNGLTSPQFSSATNANLDNITERSDNTTDDNNGGGLAVWTAEMPTSGSTGATTVTCAVSTTMAFFTLALEPSLTGTDYAEDFADPLSLNDTAVVVQSIVRSFSDLAGLSDTPGNALTVSKSFSDVEALAETHEIVAGTSMNINDTAALSDSMSWGVERLPFVMYKVITVELLPDL